MDALKKEYQRILEGFLARTEAYATPAHRIEVVRDLVSRAISSQLPQDKKVAAERRRFLAISLAYLAVDEPERDVREVMAEAARSLVSVGNRLQHEVADIVAGMVALRDADGAASLQKLSDRLSELPEEALEFVGEHAQDDGLPKDVREELVHVLVNSGSLKALEPLLNLLESGKCIHKRLPYIGVKNILKNAQMDEHGVLRPK